MDSSSVSSINLNSLYFYILFCMLLNSSMFILPIIILNKANKSIPKTEF